jgi:hypothetical protein
MPTLHLINDYGSGRNHFFTFANATPETVSAAFSQYMQSQGYKMESGHFVRGTFGIGNQVMRILFGAFVKRFTFDFMIQPQETNTLLELAKGMSGMSGGVIGMAKISTEFRRISNDIRML